MRLRALILPLLLCVGDAQQRRLQRQQQTQSNIFLRNKGGSSSKASGKGGKGSKRIPHLPPTSSKGKGKGKGKGKDSSRSSKTTAPAPTPTVAPTAAPTQAPTPTVAPTAAPTQERTLPPPTLAPTADIQGPFCIDFDCGDGYLLRSNPETRVGDDRATCCYRAGVCAGATVGSPCSLGDIISSLIPNPSFENHTGCPTADSQLYLADTWVQATGGSSDYWIGSPTCPDSVWRAGVSGIGQLNQLATDGDAFVGSIKFAGREQYEYVGACLTASLLSGVEYTLNLDVAAATSSGSYGGDTNGDTELLCIPDCNSFPISGTGYMGNTYQVLASASPGGGIIGGGDWKALTFSFTPAVDCPAVMFGPAQSQSIQAGQGGTYVIYDALNLQSGAAGVCDASGECVAN